MKKTLLIAAAALAAGVISSQAQVYSQNVVGYVNVPETAGVFSLEAPTLDLDGTGTNNTIASVYTNPSINDQIYAFSGGSFSIYTYQVKTTGRGATATTVTNWFDGSGNLASGYPLLVGQGVFYLPAANETNTFVGTVLSGTVTNGFVPAANAFGLVSSQIPYGGGLTSVQGYVPNINDQVYLFNGGAYSVYGYQVKTTGRGASATTVTNWFDGSGNQNEPQISAGQGFWLNPAATTSWTEVFTNN